MDQIWQRERDIMSFAFQTENNNADRATSIALERMRESSARSAAQEKKDNALADAAGDFLSNLIFQ